MWHVTPNFLFAKHPRSSTHKTNSQNEQKTYKLFSVPVSVVLCSDPQVSACAWRQQNTNNLPHHHHSPVPYSMGIIPVSVLLPCKPVGGPEAPRRNHGVFRDDVHLLVLDVIKQVPSMLSCWWPYSFHYFPQFLLRSASSPEPLNSYSGHGDSVSDTQAGCYSFSDTQPQSLSQMLLPRTHNGPMPLPELKQIEPRGPGPPWPGEEGPTVEHAPGPQ